MGLTPQKEAVFSEGGIEVDWWGLNPHFKIQLYSFFIDAMNFWSFFKSINGILSYLTKTKLTLEIIRFI